MTTATARWRVTVGALVVSAFLLLTASPVRAQAQVDARPTVVQPGETVTVTGLRGFASGPIVEVRLDDVTGPVLATSPTAQSAFPTIEVPIPADIKVGSHVLLITQALRRTDAGVRGLPARVAIQVTGPGGLAIRGDDPRELRPVQGLPADLVVEKEPGPALSVLVLVSLGVAALVLIVAVPGARALQRRSHGGSGRASTGHA